MVVPQHNQFRPLYTGWFAEFGTLNQTKTAQVQYSENGYQFAGATMDFTALYRLEAVLDLYQQQHITIDAVHQHVQQLQQAFLVELAQQQHPLLNHDALLAQDLTHHGHFLTFRLPSLEQVSALASYLKNHKIHTDYRGDRLRFGFAPYQDATDFDLSCLQVHKG